MNKKTIVKYLDSERIVGERVRDAIGLAMIEAEKMTVKMVTDMLKKLPFHPEPWEYYQKHPEFDEGVPTGRMLPGKCLCFTCHAIDEIEKLVSKENFTNETPR